MPSTHDFRGLDAVGFRAAIFDPVQSRPRTVVGPRGKQADKRFNVYRNNVTVSLIDALADTFPAVQRITGEPFFRAMAREFVRTHPPTSPLLFLYGSKFPAFIADFEHAASMPYLADVARVERTWLTAYHAADLKPLAPQALAAIDPEHLADVTFQPHPAAGLVCSRFAVFDIYDANRNAGTVGKIDATRAQSVLVSRPNRDVTVTALPDGHDVFFERLLSGGTLGQAAEASMESTEIFDINQAIGGILSSGAFIAVNTAD